MDNLKAVTDGKRHELTQKISASEDVQFQWCMIAVDMSEDVAQTLLNMIIDMWVNIRGFHLSSATLNFISNDRRSHNAPKGYERNCSLLN